MKIEPIFAWYDIWIGAFWNREKRWLYVLPFFCVGFVVKFGVGLSPRALLPWNRLNRSQRKWLRENNANVTRIRGDQFYSSEIHFPGVPWHEGGFRYDSYRNYGAETPRLAFEKAVACLAAYKQSQPKNGGSS